MSGGDIAYHLRPNKAVERALFLDLLGRIGRTAFNISSYEYIGFGGPFMEDFKAIHIATRISKLTCLERSAVVQARQKFNSSVKGVKFVLGDSSAYLDSLHPDGPTLIWLDFTSPGELGQQLDDSKKLVNKLAHGDIFKVTLNASASALQEKIPGVSPAQTLLLRRKCFEDRVGVDLPVGIKDTDFKSDAYPKLLLAALRNAFDRGAVPSGLVVQPLTSFVYSDGTTMLTATGIVLDPKEIVVGNFPATSRLVHWPFAMLNWEYPREIDLPVLSLKERMVLESMQPGGTVVDAKAELGAAVDSGGISPKAVNSFAQFYRIYPDFVRATL